MYVRLEYTMSRYSAARSDVADLIQVMCPGRSEIYLKGCDLVQNTTTTVGCDREAHAIVSSMWYKEAVVLDDMLQSTHDCVDDDVADVDTLTRRSRLKCNMFIRVKRRWYLMICCGYTVVVAYVAIRVSPNSLPSTARAAAAIRRDLFDLFATTHRRCRRLLWTLDVSSQLSSVYGYGGEEEQRREQRLDPHHHYREPVVRDHRVQTCGVLEVKHAAQTIHEQQHEDDRGNDPRRRVRHVRVFVIGAGVVATIRCRRLLLLLLLLLLPTRRSYLTHVSYEHVDVHNGNERRDERADRRDDVKLVFRRQLLASALAVHQRHLEEVWNVQRVPDRVASHEVQRDNTAVEAGRLFWRPGQDQLLDGKQEQVPSGDGGLRPEQELAMPDSTHANINTGLSSAPHWRRSQQNVTRDAYRRVKERLVLHQHQPGTQPLRP